jgi:hypothetical protein
MWHGQVRIVDLLVAVEKEIEVDRARPEPLGSNPAELAFDALQRFEQRVRLELRGDLHDGVQEVALFRAADRRGLVDARGADDANVRRTRQVPHRSAEVLQPVAHVRADTDVGGRSHARLSRA